MTLDTILRDLEKDGERGTVEVINALLAKLNRAKGLLEVSQPPRGVIARLKWEDGMKEFLDD